MKTLCKKFNLLLGNTQNMAVEFSKPFHIILEKNFETSEKSINLRGKYDESRQKQTQ